MSGVRRTLISGFDPARQGCMAFLSTAALTPWMEVHEPEPESFADKAKDSVLLWSLVCFGFWGIKSPERGFVESAQFPTMQFRAEIAQDTDGLDADLDMFGDSAFIKMIGLTRQFQFAV